MAGSPRVTVVGAGLAGCEAAWQASRLGASVSLLDIKPAKRTPAHNMDGFAELVCSNSLGSASVDSAKGLLKQELRELGSLIIECADRCRVPAGGALAVDRVKFSETVTGALRACANIRVECVEAAEIPIDRPCIIATGPLTTQGLLADIAVKLGNGCLYFFDAASPIVAYDSINVAATFHASRYGKGEGGYINCPMDRTQYERFWTELCAAQSVEPHGFEDDKVFEGCVPIEILAKRGIDTLRFGPLKPKGLVDPQTGRMPYAAVQLRQDDLGGELYNLVGFQTKLRFSEQRRVFSTIPGLESARFVRYGVMHKNAYINSPGVLDRTYAVRADPELYFAGQISGVEGYVESVSSGLTAGINAALRARRESAALEFPHETLIGALARYVSDERGGGATNARFDPMNANFGILPPISRTERRMSKKERYAAIAERSLRQIKESAAAADKFRQAWGRQNDDFRED